MAQPSIQAAGETQSFAARQARLLLRRLALQIDRTVKSSNADAVHQVRVAIRRFTQAIAACQPPMPEKDMRKSRRRLKKIMAAAGEVRNCDVALKYLARWREPSAVGIQSKIESRRKESSLVLVAELKGWTDRQLSSKWRAALAAHPRETSAREVARHALGRLAKDFLARGNEAASLKASPHDMHRFRIVSKKFRYTLELFQPLYGSSVDRTVASIKRVGTLLGDINDCVTVAEIVAPYHGGNRLATRLKRRQRKKTEDFRQFWKGEFADAWIKKPMATSGHAFRRKSVA